MAGRQRREKIELSLDLSSLLCRSLEMTIFSKNFKTKTHGTTQFFPEAGQRKGIPNEILTYIPGVYEEYSSTTGLGTLLSGIES